VTIDGKGGAAVTITSACTAQIVVDVDDDWGLDAVRIYDGDALLADLDAPPFTAPWLIDDVVAETSHTLTIEAVDSRGQTTDATVDVDFELPSGGSSLWEDAGPVHYVGAALDVTIAGSGSVVAVGSRALTGAPSQAVLRRLSPFSGETELDVAYPPSAALDGDYRGSAVLVVSGDEVVVAGDITPTSDPSCPFPWIARFSSAGELVAERRLYGGCGRLTALAAVDGELLIAGARFDTDEDEDEAHAWIARLDGDLSIAWERTLAPAAARSIANAVVVDASDAIYVAGTRFDDDHNQILAARLSPDDGALVWGDPLETEGDEDAFGEAIVIGAEGEVAIGGAVESGGGEQMMIRWLRRADGETLDLFLLPDLGAGDQRIRALTVDAHDRIYVAGTTTTADDDVDAVVYKRSHDGGAEFWERIYDSGANEHDRGSAIAVDDHGFVFAAGSRSVVNTDRPRWWIAGHNP
jgi:hypothetical protein